MINTLRILALTMMTVVVALGVVLFVVLGDVDEPFAMPDTWALIAVVAVGAAANLAIPVIGYQAPAVKPGEPRASYVPAFQAGMMLRCSLGEGIALVACALSFVTSQGGLVLYLVGAVIALVTMAIHGYPSDACVERVRARLERDGGVSYLREDLGLPPKSVGAIQEL